MKIGIRVLDLCLVSLSGPVDPKLVVRPQTPKATLLQHEKYFM